MVELVFVYGSLMRKVPSAASKWLYQHAAFITEDTVLGRLYDLGQYPGLVLDQESGKLICGEVHQLYQPASGIPFLDQYEGLDMDVPEYERLLCTTSGGHQCWIYQYLNRTASSPEIPTEDYSTYYRSNMRHKQFIHGTDA